jgi:CubicO group peptidase (beta-lactamase class C family)
MRRSSLSLAVCLLFCGMAAAGQQRLATGPPPEIRELVEAFSSAVAGNSADAWDAMTRERFAPEWLAAHPADERRQLFDQLQADFAGARRGPVMRRGPDAPLELQMIGPSGPVGTIILELTSGMPPLITGISVEKDGGANNGSNPDGPPPPPIHPGMTKVEMSAALDDYLRRLAGDGRLSGVALVARNGATWFEAAYGFANRGDRVANAVDTRFNIGSINKAFTRMATEQLIAEGKLSRTDTLGVLIPDYPQAVSRNATVDQLLNHTAGIADFFGPAFDDEAKDRFRSNEDYYRFVSQLAPTFAPGARNQYCNGCYIVLGAIIERIARMPYERYVTERIFTPAGMKDTGFLQVDGAEPRVAIGYTTRGAGGGVRSNLLMHGAAGSAAGGSYSTVRDLLTFVDAQRRGRLPGNGDLGIAGGAPGTNAVLESDGEWTIVVLTNLDPPFGEQLGQAIAHRLRGR